MNNRIDIGLHPSLRGSALLRAWVSLALIVSLLFAVLHVHDFVRVVSAGGPGISTVHTVDTGAQDKDCRLCLAMRGTALSVLFALMVTVRVAYARPLGAALLPSLPRLTSAQPRAPPAAA